MDIRRVPGRDQRRSLLEDELHISLQALKQSTVDEEDAIHGENLIGAISLPVGVAGPLPVAGLLMNRAVYVPLATTEGALIASVHRGCKAIREAGHAVVRTQLVGATRGPIFTVAGIEEGSAFMQWLKERRAELAAVVAQTSSHLTLSDIQTAMNGRQVYVRFVYDTQDAMGMNMATIATDAIARYIENKKHIRCSAIAGNFDTDKKPSWNTMIQGRGRRGWGEVTIPSGVVRSVLKVEPADLERTIRYKCGVGSALSGSLGFNAHFANIVAAFYAATGQDLAHVVEGSHGVTSAELLANDDLYVSVFLPAIMIGTVGGGTSLKTQTAARSITGTSRAAELVEVLIATVLAGELSLLASITEQSLAKAHQKLGR